MNYYRHLVDVLRDEFPKVDFEFTLDCGDDAALAFEARRMGLDVILSGVKDRVEPSNTSPDPSLRSG